MPTPTEPRLETDNIHPPLSTSTIFMSPLETIIESLDDQYDPISLHDITEAYNVFSVRIRSHIQSILQGNHTYPAFTAIKENSSKLIRALRRDIRRSLVKPTSEYHRVFSIDDPYVSDERLNEDEIQLARNSSSLCHHALRLASDVLSFPPLFSAMPSSELVALLDDILTVVLGTDLPTLSSKRTQTLAMWILQVQRLPFCVLSSHSHRLVMALKRAICNEIGKQQAVLDGLKATCNLLQNHSEQFLSPLSDLLPSILPLLIAGSHEIRYQAAHALSGFAYAKMNTLSNPDNCFQSISGTVRSFIESQTCRKKTTEVRLPAVIMSAIEVMKAPRTGDGPTWAVCVLTSLTVLSDAYLFSHAPTLKLVISSLAVAATNKRTAVRELQPLVWRCLVWAFSRLSADLHQMRDGEDDAKGMKERAFRVIIQELGGGNAIAVSALLLCSEGDPEPTADSVPKVLGIVNDLIGSDKKHSRHEGVAILTRLLSLIGAHCGSKAIDVDQNTFVTRELVNGAILHCRWEELGRLVDSLAPPAIDSIRQLSEDEIIKHWDALVDIWTVVVRSSIRDSDIMVSGDLVQVWQSLLLVQGQLTQGNERLTPPSNIASRAGIIIAAFLTPLGDTESQARHLSVVKKLWAVMKNVFDKPCLAVSAEIVFGVLIREDFEISHQQVFVGWGRLVVEAALTLNANFGQVVRNIEAKLAAVDTRLLKSVWNTLSKRCELKSFESSWEDLVVFFVVPFTIWSMVQSEMGIWNTILGRILEMASAAGVETNTVLSRILVKLGEEKIARLSSFPKEALLLLARVDFAHPDILPMEMLLMLDNILFCLYPPTPETEALPISLEYLRLVDTVIMRTSSKLQMPLLKPIQRSLRRWIMDEHKALSDAAYNELAMSIYSNSLDILSRHEPSLDMLTLFEPFLTSSFYRSPPPALGPMAFQKFWKATFDGREEFHKPYPGIIDECLISLRANYGVNAVVGLSQSTDSQQTPSSVIPDSEPCRSDPRSSGGFHDAQRLLSRVGDGMSSPTSSTAITFQAMLERSPSSRPRRPTALQYLQDYSSNADISSIQSSTHSSGLQNMTTQHMHSKASFEQGSSRDNDATFSLRPAPLKRPSDGDSSYSKRRKLERPNSTSPPTSGKRKQASSSSSQAVSPTATALSGRQTTVFDGAELPAFREVLARRDGESQLMTPESSFHYHESPSPDAGEDYASWEMHVSPSEVRRELSSINNMDVDLAVPQSPDTEVPLDDTEIILSPSLRGKQRDRSQTAPTFGDLHHSSPLRRNRTTSASLNALNQAYDLFNEASQIPEQDLEEAKRLVQKLGLALAEQKQRKSKAHG